jgi:hypothetical protein
VFVEQIGCFDRVCLLLGLEVGEWFLGELSVSLSGPLRKTTELYIVLRNVVSTTQNSTGRLTRTRYSSDGRIPQLWNSAERIPQLWNSTRP